MTYIGLGGRLSFRVASLRAVALEASVPAETLALTLKLTRAKLSCG
ncbi:hypothetical protein FHS72_000772 [Loktanella ponticola]|uniref:Uncharacterized protein n=1 Tax=Yoonia ponticola TaxID=1524255 RepID=A0A7W9EYI6_9RHOB|nr:hypothetical protein [Yoonia ponticola]